MCYRARVESPVRLHLGFVDPPGDRSYGGVGVGVEGPGAVVEAMPSGRLEVDAVDPGDVDRLRRYVEALDVDGVEVVLRRGVPAHVGLGSGTQTALSVAEASALVRSLDVDLYDVARLLGRGDRSGVGVGVYRSGGLVADSGVGDGVPRPAVDLDLPSDWRFVVVSGEGRGPSGADEESAMEAYSAVESTDDALRAFYGLVASAAEADVVSFGEAASEFNRLNGERYVEAGVQDDVYVMQSVVDDLLSFDSVYGAGQSSWGPSAWGLSREGEAAEVAASFESAWVASPSSGRCRRLLYADD
ncbi:MAG: GHMP kinase [Halobacteriota archaeon]